MARKCFSVVLFLSLVGCQGPAGHDGAPGRDGVFTRTASYCNTFASSATAGSAWSISTSCTSMTDMPLSGQCLEPEGLPPGAYLSASTPINWDVTTAIAGWRCQWAWAPVAITSDFAATAEICCARP